MIKKMDRKKSQIVNFFTLPFSPSLSKNVGNEELLNQTIAIYLSNLKITLIKMQKQT